MSPKRNSNPMESFEIATGQYYELINNAGVPNNSLIDRLVSLDTLATELISQDRNRVEEIADVMHGVYIKAVVVETVPPLSAVQRSSFGNSAKTYSFLLESSKAAKLTKAGPTPTAGIQTDDPKKSK